MRLQILLAVVIVGLTVLATNPTLIALGEETAVDRQRAPARAESVDDRLIRLVQHTWPLNRSAPLYVLYCESRTGLDPDAWRTDTADGGPFQINRETWERFLLDRYSWSWEQVALDVQTNVAAARVIYDQTGDFSAWSCSKGLP